MNARVGIVIAVVVVAAAVAGYFSFLRPSTTITAQAPAVAAPIVADVPVTTAVDPAKPFGDIDIKPAVSLTAKATATWVAALTKAQQTDLNTRCNYMLEREGEYRVDDLTFCQQWQFGRSPGL